MPGGVLIADDEPEIHELLAPYLRREGFAVRDAFSGTEAVAAARAEEPVAMLLDVMLPGLDGMEVCRELRRTCGFPILFLTARGEELDKVLGLGLGADDYITKPFSPAEVVARVKAQLRRHQRQAEAPAAAPGPGSSGWAARPPSVAPLRAGALTVDPDTASARIGERTVELTAQELRLLATFARSPRRVFTKRQLYEAAWEQPWVGDDNTVMVAVRRLREKVEDDPDHPRRIQTVRGLGYRLAIPPGERA
jgi:DNA-binding response OmpR family regulator